MAFLSCMPSRFLRLQRDLYAMLPICEQLRWKKKNKIRKPTWMPTAAAKVFRIPEHPYVPPDEEQLIDDLLDEYYRKVESLRMLFQAELKQKSIDDGTASEKKKLDEKEFALLLEENSKENERVKVIREETLEKLFQEYQLKLLQLEEERLKEQEKAKLKVEELVRKEKEKYSSFIDYEKLDAAIEYAIDHPINVNFAITVDGSVKWEGNPPPEFEKELQRRIAESRQRKVL